MLPSPAPSSAPYYDDYGADELELRDYLTVLNRRKWIVIGVTLGVLVVAVVVSLVQTPIYRSEAELLLQPKTTESIFDPSVVQTLAASDKAAPTEMRVIQSQPVRQLVRQELAIDPPEITVTNPPESDFLIVAAEDPDPEQAAAIANAYARAYVEYRRQQAISELEDAADQLGARIAEINAQIAGIEAAAAATGDSAGARAAARGQVDEEALAAALRSRDLHQSRLDQLQLAITQKTGGAQLVTEAVPETDPVRPTPARNAAVALVLGLVLGIGLAFLRDYLDDTIKRKEDVERVLPGLPVLGLIPALSGWKNRDDALLVSLSDPKSPAAEAYRALRTSVQFLGVERRMRLVQITSPSASEGKSTTITNLAVALAGAGQRVMLVDGDLRRPRLHKFLGGGTGHGLTSVLLGDAPLSAAVGEQPDVAGLRVLPAGPIPPNPSEILGGEHLAELLRALEASADLVLIDSPPVLPVTDAAVLARRVDATILVVSAGSTGQKELKRAAETLSQVGAPLLGVVLNGVKEDVRYSYSYRYRYYSSDEPTRSKRRAAPARTQAPVPVGVPASASGSGGTSGSPATSGSPGTPAKPEPPANGRGDGNGHSGASEAGGTAAASGDDRSTT